MSKLNTSCPKNVQSDKKTCQEVIKLCSLFSKLCLPSSKLFLILKTMFGQDVNKLNLQVLDQSLITHANWKVKSSMQQSVKKWCQQECIPVGCIPSTTVAACSLGGCSQGGLLPGGSAPGGGVVAQHALRQTPLWTDRQV